MKTPAAFFLVLLFFVNAIAQSVQPNPVLEKRSIFFVPLLSGLFPSFGQFKDGEAKKGIIILGFAATGILIADEAKKRQKEFLQSDSLGWHGYNDNVRAEEFGLGMFKHAGQFSLYESFLNRVEDYKAEGKYLFLPVEQNLESIHKAPFKFEYLTRWTTFVPLLLGLAGGATNYNRSPVPEHFNIRLVDATTSTYRSYVAGVGEEAMFRGWLQPIIYENTQNFWLSNSIQGLAFGFAHGPRPYIQTVFGLYSGWLTQRNNWDLSESIFIHTWWDIFIITAEAARSRSFTSDFYIQLPMFEASF